MACDVITVRLHLAQIRVLEVVEDTPGALVVSVESTFRRLRCAQCGFKCHRVHDRRAKKVRDLEVSGRRMTLVWQRRRMVCDNCASRFLEDHPAFEGALTARLSRRVVADAKVMTFSAVARRHGVHWHAVRALVDTWSALVAERRRSRRCSVLLVDETSMRKRHRYVTVIVNGDTGRTLAMVEHRSSAALSTFLMQQGHRWCKGVKVVVSDGSKAYKAAIDAHLGHARHVLDRFGVIRWFAAGLTAVRRDVQRRPEGSKPAFDPEVFRARFALLRRGDTLTDADRVRLDALFDAHPRLRAGWQALQELHGLYLADDYDGALKALGRFCDLYETGELPEYHDTVDTIIAWTDEILNWHHTDRASNGRNRRNQQPAPSAAPKRPRVHKPTQLRSPRHPRDIMTQPVPATLNPTNTRKAQINRPEFTDGTRDEGCLGYPESICCPIAGRSATEREATPSRRIDVGDLDDVGLR